MRKSVLLIALFALVAFASGVMAQPTSPAPALKYEKHRFRGEIEKVDEKAKTITVRGVRVGNVSENHQDFMTFVINDKTKIAGATKSNPLGHLKTGTRCAVDYFMPQEAGKFAYNPVAIKIEYSSPKLAPEKVQSRTGGPRAKVPAPEVVNLLPQMQKTALREGRNAIHTTRTGAQIIAIVREKSVVGYDVVDQHGKPLPMTIVPDPIQEERARKIKERSERAAKDAAERERCLELLGLGPIEKGCWVAFQILAGDEIGGGMSVVAYVDCPKGI